jgi:hypothetical protein
MITETSEWTVELHSEGRWFGWYWQLRGPQGPKDPKSGLWPPQYYASGYTTTRRGAVREARRRRDRVLRRAARSRESRITLPIDAS